MRRIIYKLWGGFGRDYRFRCSRSSRWRFIIDRVGGCGGWLRGARSGGGKLGLEGEGKKIKNRGMPGLVGTGEGSDDGSGDVGVGCLIERLGMGPSRELESAR
jgi:hypothetical protein